ncbi:MAG: PAS domain S-box protein [Pseudomonadota bacterium]|nr:PAS domain S-box protein [Pseudomonadota bacterium]
MENQAIIEKNPAWMKRNFILLGIVWTLIMAVLLGWNLRNHKKHLLESVTGYARSSYNKDVVYWRWMANHGGVYVPPTAKTLPNPYLAKHPHRDVTTTDGMKLTQITPAYMTRQVFELGQEQYGYRGHISSLKPLRPENRPDSWEKKALTAFETGTSELVEVQALGGDRYLRLMRPLLVEKGCLECHADQGYKLGDTRGGVSVSINLEPILAAAGSHWWNIGFTYGGIWLLGLLGIGFSYFHFKKGLQQLMDQKKLLRQSRDRFKNFYQRAPVAFQSLDKDGVVLEVNETWLLFLGYQRDEVIGKKIATFLTPDSVEVFSQLFAQFKIADHVEGVLLELKHYNGCTIKGSFFGRIERDEQGNFQRTICVFHDITKNIEQQETIQRLQQRNENILMAAGEGIIGLDDKRKPIFVNPAALDMLGFSQEELLGRDSHATWHRYEQEIDSPGGNVCRICRAMETENEKIRIIETLYRADGSSFPAELTISPIMEGGNRMGSVVVFVDISQRLHQEREQRRMAAVIKQTGSVVVLTDLKRIITYVNPAFEKQSGYPAAEVLGQEYSILLDRDSEEGLRAARQLWQRLESGESWSGILYTRRKDGTIAVNKTNAFPIIGDDGKVIDYATVKHDITHEKEMEQQLAQAGKMESIGQLAGGVAHDFNNILTVINGYAQVVLMQQEEGSKLWYDVREIEKAGDRAADLTRQLLTFSRKQLIMPRELRANDEIAEMEKMIRRLIGEDVELEISLAEDLPPIYADPSQLQQILLNLVVNARDALGIKVAGGEKRITISTSQKYLDDDYAALHAGSRQGWHVQIQVEDNGAGMAKEVVDHIFEPFYTTKAVGEGTGMGLATVYGIVKQNNGSIYVYSEPGQGTSFKIYWPIIDEKATKVGDKESAEPVVGGNETILMVEDDAGIRKIISRQLSDAGYTVIEAENGMDALEQAGNHQGTIDLLFTDVIMPTMGGSELYGKIKDIFPDITVLFGSGYTDDKLPEDILLLAKDQFIHKPYNLKEVVPRIRSLLDD